MATSLSAAQSLPTMFTLREKYRALADKHHPDKGGDSRTMAKINVAFTFVKSSIR